MLSVVLAGFAVAWLPVLAPIHEAGHVIVGIIDPRVSVHAVQWRTTFFTGSPGELFYAAGHLFSALATGAIAMWLSLRKGAVLLAMFFVGHTVNQPFYAFFSMDFFQLTQSAGYGAFWPWITATAVVSALSALLGLSAALYARELRHEQFRRKITT
jgi:hypothetical protein